MKKNLDIKGSLIVLVAIWLPFVAASHAGADSAVKLRLLVIATGEAEEDLGLAYIKPVLEEMGVPYDVLNAATHDLTPAVLASSPTGAGCKAENTGCVGNYNGFILTDADLVPSFTPSEWDILHDYQKNFGSVKPCCRGGRQPIRMHRLLTGSTSIMVWSIRPPGMITKAGGQFLLDIARKCLSMSTGLIPFQLQDLPSQPIRGMTVAGYGMVPYPTLSLFS